MGSSRLKKGSDSPDKMGSGNLSICELPSERVGSKKPKKGIVNRKERGPERCTWKEEEQIRYYKRTKRGVKQKRGAHTIWNPLKSKRIGK